MQSPAYIYWMYFNSHTPIQAFLITAGVTALYINMKIDPILESVREIFTEFPNSSRLVTKIFMLLNLVLRNNVY